jgi:TPR repeat protein
MARGENAEAADWLRGPAEAGNVSAMADLGVALGRLGWIRDSLRWWRRAAAAGDPWAAGKLQEAREAGLGDEMD